MRRVELSSVRTFVLAKKDWREGPITVYCARPILWLAEPLTFHIDLVGREDLSGEIYRQIRRAIVDGLLQANDRLPPSRELARTLAVARATVVIAYERLAGEGFIRSIQGAGTFVSERALPVGKAGPRQRTQSALQARPVWEAVPLPTAFDGAAEYDFRTGLPDVSLFPHQHWRRLVTQVLRKSERASKVVYQPPAGDRQLRAAVARHIAISRGIDAGSEDVVVTNGTQQAIDIVARVLLTAGDQIAVEDPGYEPPRRAFEAHGARAVGVPVDAEGLVVTALPDNTRAAYVTPSHQYPLSVPMSLARRQALLAWADKHGAAIIEDDYDGEFRFEGRPLPPLQTLDRTGRVIYVGSFSKTMLPTLRLGFIVAPPSLRAAVQKAKYVSDWHTSSLEQAALASFIENGGFARHVRKVGSVYRERHQLVAEIVARDFADHLELIPSTTGLHLAALAPSESVESMAVVAARAGKLGVQFHRLSSFAVGEVAMTGLVLGYGAISTEKIMEGLRRLRSCFDR